MITQTLKGGEYMTIDDTRDKLNAVHRPMKNKRYPRNMMNKGF